MSHHLIARRHLFSTAHLYSQKRFTAEENKRVFGACYTPHGHGHNYILEAFVSGPLDQETGLVLNVNDLDVHMKKVCAILDHKHISFDVPEFNNAIPTTENLAAFIHSRLEKELKSSHPSLSLHHIRLFETDDLWAEAGGAFGIESEGATLTSQIEIRSIHHLENKSYSEQKNRDVYGICFGEHGHHYQVQVTCKGSIDPKSGLIVNRDKLASLLKTKIVDRYDGVDLNKVFANTSCEALAKEFYQILSKDLPTLVKVGIQETRKNYFEFPVE